MRGIEQMNFREMMGQFLQQTGQTMTVKHKPLKSAHAEMPWKKLSQN